MRHSHEWQAYIGENQELTIEGEVDYSVTPGDPGCRYTRNGDGWPPSPPEVEFFGERITSIVLSIGEEKIEFPSPGHWKLSPIKNRVSLHNLTAAEQKIWAETIYSQLVNQDELTDHILAEHCGPPEPPDCDN